MKEADITIVVWCLVTAFSTEVSFFSNPVTCRQDQRMRRLLWDGAPRTAASRFGSPCLLGRRSLSTRARRHRVDGAVDLSRAGGKARKGAKAEGTGGGKTGT
jgi:hypothetical protein